MSSSCCSRRSIRSGKPKSWPRNCAAIRDQTLRIGARDISVTISVGCAVFPVDAENPVDMLKAADAALYEVKHRGRDGYADRHRRANRRLGDDADRRFR